ncbi:MAG: GGDEF domain-containing protein, partial [Methylovulum sp.]|nr:GGDEF domain-containing protein [Methylovulum sp.]
KPSLLDEKQSSIIWAALKEKGHWDGEIWERNQQGELEPEWLTFSAIKNEQGKTTNYVAIFSSISELIKRQQLLEGIANHDALTGLPNRRLLADRLSQATIHANRNQKSLAVCYLDLDGFKQVNDVFGHAAGDTLLQEIAQRFKSILRGNDTVARLGGDEFVLLFNDLNKSEDVFALLDRLLAVAKEPVVFENVQARVSASIGVSFFPVDSNDADMLMKFADEAMYHAKHKGKSQYYIHKPGATSMVAP